MSRRRIRLAARPGGGIMPRMTTRRHFLGAAAAAAGAAVVGQGRATAQAPDAPPRVRPNRIGISTYSFWRFLPNSKVKIEDCIRQSAAMGFDGVEILHRQMDGAAPGDNTRLDNAYLQSLKRIAITEGVDLCGFSIHQGFVYPDAAARRKNVDHTLECIELAYAMGIPTMRLNTGRWNTTKDFDQLMKDRGEEPRLPGYKDDEEAFKWVCDSIAQCLKKAEQCGVLLALENHWGLGRTPEGVLRIVNTVNSPWLMALMDTGNFLEDPYAKLEQMAPKTAYVQAKTYFGGGLWYALDLDYARIAQILRKNDYHGYVALEFEGKEDYRTAIPKSLAVLRRAFS
jgi:sugar phosphate isomerase/epimerase